MLQPSLTCCIGCACDISRLMLIPMRGDWCMAGAILKLQGSSPSGLFAPNVIIVTGFNCLYWSYERGVTPMEVWRASKMGMGGKEKNWDCCSWLESVNGLNCFIIKAFIIIRLLLKIAHSWLLSPFLTVLGVKDHEPLSYSYMELSRHAL